MHSTFSGDLLTLYLMGDMVHQESICVIEQRFVYVLPSAIAPAVKSLTEWHVRVLRGKIMFRVFQGTLRLKKVAVRSMVISVSEIGYRTTVMGCTKLTTRSHDSCTLRYISTSVLNGTIILS